LHGEDATSGISTTRQISKANMIIIIGEDIYHSTEIFVDTSRFFVLEQLELFVWATIMLSLCLTAYFVIFSMLLIKFLVVSPINELTGHICNP